MELKMEWQGKLAFSGTAPSGHEVVTDSLPEFGGEGRAPTPMEMLIAAVIGCSGIDIVSILQKMKLSMEKFQVEAKGERAESHPKRYTSIEMHYIVSGDIPEDKLVRAIELSLNKYCSVAHSLNADMKASYSLNNGEKKKVKLA